MANSIWNRRDFLKMTGAGLAGMFLPVGLSHSADTAARPNIIVVLVDDMGYSDLSCYGGEIQTPNIDRMGQNGIRFKQFYNTAKCSPTRACLLTGLYPQQAGAGIQRGVTMGQAMQSAGYVTMAVGKWHLNGTPETRGFDRAFGHISGSTHYFRGDKTFHLDGKPYKIPENFYVTDANTDYAMKFIDEEHRKDSTKPFFMYLAFNAPHYPLHALPEDIARYRGKFKKGWDHLRRLRYARQLELGIIKKQWRLSPRPDYVPAWDSLTDKEKDFEDLRMAVYAAMIHRIDVGIGRITEKLRELGVEKDTLILFMSDNGGCPFDRRCHGIPGPADSYWEYGPAWATLSNTPFRLYKRNQHEGGTSTPMIAHWPAGIDKPGRWSDDIGHLIDIMPTALELAGGKYPSSQNGKPLPKLPGRSMLPIFKDEAFGQRDDLFFHYSSHRAMISGKWKLVSAFNKPWELYQLDIDRTELNDLASELPQKVKEMDAKFRRWWKSVGQKPFELKSGKGGVPPYRSVFDKSKRRP